MSKNTLIIQIKSLTSQMNPFNLKYMLEFHKILITQIIYWFTQVNARSFKNAFYALQLFK